VGDAPTNQPSSFRIIFYSVAPLCYAIVHAVLCRVYLEFLREHTSFRHIIRARRVSVTRLNVTVSLQLANVKTSFRLRLRYHLRIHRVCELYSLNNKFEWYKEKRSSRRTTVGKSHGKVKPFTISQLSHQDPISKSSYYGIVGCFRVCINSNMRLRQVRTLKWHKHVDKVAIALADSASRFDLRLFTTSFPPTVSP